MTEEYENGYVNVKTGYMQIFTPKDSFKTTQHCNITTGTTDDEQKNYCTKIFNDLCLISVVFFIVFIPVVLYMSRNTMLFLLFSLTYSVEPPAPATVRMSEVVRAHWKYKYIRLMVSLIFI